MSPKTLFENIHELFDQEESDGSSLDAICFPWLLHFRWITVISLLFLTNVARRIFEVNLSLVVPVFLVLLLLISNAVLLYRLQLGKIINFKRLAAGAMFFDVTVLTIFFCLISCALNPFVILYVIYFFFGALLLRPGWSLLLVCFTLAGYAGFFFSADPMIMDDKALGKVLEAGLLPGGADLEAFQFFAASIKGDLVSYSRVMFIVMFAVLVIMGFLVSRVRSSIEKQQKTINDLEKVKSRTDKLAALATFAAGAAHEFSTPLSTIAVASGEMLYHMREQGGSQDLIDDCRLIRDQVSRCKEILYQMAADAGEHLGENVETFAVRDLISNVLESFAPDVQKYLVFANNVESMQLTLPIRTLVRTLRNVLKNAMDASESGSPIFLTCNMNKTHIFFTVRDYGSGMDEETVARALDPFFTTKAPGKGMGLGLYLAQTMVQRYGGEVFIESRPDDGTTVTLTFARNQVHAVLAAN